MRGESIDTENLQPAEHLKGKRPEGQGRLLTVQEAAHLLSVSPNTIRGLCQKRKLRHVRIGLGKGAIRIDPAALDQFKRSATVELAAEIEPLRKPRSTRVQQLKNLSLD